VELQASVLPRQSAMFHDAARLGGKSSTSVSYRTSSSTFAGSTVRQCAISRWYPRWKPAQFAKIVGEGLFAGEQFGEARKTRIHRIANDVDDPRVPAARDG